jgi:glycosyltransferase involved in cell wall biosynthesis
VLVSVVVPVFNEISTIAELLRRLLEADFQKEVIVVDDGSNDGTAEMLQLLQKNGCSALGQVRTDRIERVEVILQRVNQGKGAALRAGFARFRGEIVVIQDGDLEYDPREIPRLIQPIVEGFADVVYGSRFTGTPRRVLYFWHTVLNNLLTTASNVATGLNLTDMETCYKAFRREVVEKIQIEEDRFGVEPELTAKIARRRYRIYEVPISYRGRTYEEGKKIGWKDGARALYAIAKYRLKS